MDEIDHGLLDTLVGYRIRLVQIAAFKDFEAVTQGFGQAPRYFGLLTLIENNPGLPQGRLAEAVHLVRSSLVPILDSLEADGIVERRGSVTDRRTKSVWLTKKGARVLGQLRPHVTDHEARMTASLSAQEKATLLYLLQKVASDLKTTSDKEPLDQAKRPVRINGGNGVKGSRDTVHRRH